MISKLIGNAILSILTIVIFFFGILSFYIWSATNFVVWILTVGIALTLYAIAVVKVSKHFGLPLEEKLSELSPTFVALLEVVFPGIGFTYIGKQKRRNYTLIGLAIFLTYLMGASLLTYLIVTLELIFFGGLMELYVLIFRIITPIIAYRTVQKLRVKH